MNSDMNKKKGVDLILTRLNSIFLLIFVPLFLLLCIVLKINFLSLIYIIFLIFLPILYPISEKSIAHEFRKYLISIIIICVLNLTGQAIFQIVLFSNRPSSKLVPNCSYKQEILEEFGFPLFDKIYVSDIFRIIIPDICLLMTAISSYYLCRKVHGINIRLKRESIYNNKEISSRDTTFTDHFCPLKNMSFNLNNMENIKNDMPCTSHSCCNDNNTDIRQDKTKNHINKSSSLERFLRILFPILSESIFLMFLFASSCIWPSVLSIPYLLLFLFLFTKWSLSKPITKYQLQIRIFLLIYIPLHLLIYYLYQLKFFQFYLPSDEIIARLMGLSNIVFTKCEQPGHFYINKNIKWQQITLPFVLILFYWLLALEFSYFRSGISIIFNKKNLTNKPANSVIDLTNNQKVEENNNLINEINEIRVEESVMNTPFNQKYQDETHPENENNSEECIKSNSKKRLIKSENNEEEKININYLKLNSNLRVNENDPNKFKPSQVTVLIDQIRSYLNSIFKFLTKQSYLLSLLSMMAWSILYHSILTLVLLIWTCLIWVLPKSRIWCLRSSPFFVLYCVSLLILEFIYGLQLTDTELPEFKQIGLYRHDVPFLHLSIKNGLLLSLWLTLRQHLTELRKERRLRSLANPNYVSNSTSIETSSISYDNNTIFQTKIIDWIYSCLVKYWIFLSSGTLLLMSCQNEVVAYRIVYMILFLYFISYFQLANKFWRKTLYIFHLTVILYSMIILFIIYIFQFDEVPSYVKKKLNIDDLMLSSIGFEKFEKKDELIVKLLTPTTFLIVNILQIHYFNKPWLSLTDIKNIKSDPEIHETAPKDVDLNVVEDKFTKENFKLLIFEYYSICTIYLWRIAELHIYHLILIIIAVFCFKKVTLLNVFLITSVIFSVLINRYKNKKRYHSIYSGFVQIWVSLFTICSMIYQLKFVNSPLVFNCTASQAKDPFLLKQQDNLKYIGIEKSNDIQENIKYYIIIFLLLTCQKIIKLRQKQIRKEANNKPEPFYSIIFEDVTYANLDVGVVNFLKYLANYFFYRFGLELCFVMTTITITVRLDSYAILYGIWLGLFLRLKRVNIAKAWTAYLLFLAILIPIQYVFCLGLPPILCYDYPWSKENLPANLITIFEKLRPWLFLSDYSNPPNSNYLIFDFLQFFFVLLQYNVFRIETTEIVISSNERGTTTSTNPSIVKIEDYGGKNNELVYEIFPYMRNPFKDFVTETNTVLDKINYVIYMYSYWIVLAIVFLTGTSRISILCLGYVIVSFFFLWYGQTFLMKPLDKLLRSWNFIVFYCYLVIFIKVFLQIVLCLIENENTVCILTEIFGVNCKLSAKPSCKLDTKANSDDVGLVWDVICFLVLIFQKRLYSSFKFEHVVNEYKSQSTLAARGAEIFKEIIYNKVRIERQKERRILEKLKENVERIRKHQSKECQQEPQEHFEAIRSGDYYMFDDEFEISDSDFTDIDDKEVDKVLKRKKFSKSSKKNKTSKESEKRKSKDEEIVHPKESPPINESEIKISKKENKNWYNIQNQTLLSLIESIQKYSLIVLDYVIDYLNTHSKDYRHVSYILTKEKLILKNDFGNIQIPNIVALVSTTIELTEEQKKQQSALNKFLQDRNDRENILAAAQEVDDKMNLKSRLNKFLISILYFMLSQTDKLCYFFMILNHIQTASLLSAPLPISIFLWAMLCIPRPTKTYWISCITYVEAVVVIKYIFQFQFFPWSRESTVFNQIVDKTITLIGIQRKDNFAIYDLFVLLVIFAHRLILKRLGLWRDYSKEDEMFLTQKAENEAYFRSLCEKKDKSDGSEDDDTEMMLLPCTSETKNENDNIEDDQTDGNKIIHRSQKTKLDENINENTRIASNYAIERESISDYNESSSSRENLIKKSKPVNWLIRFYHELGSRQYAVVIDCYAKIFLCDFINCIIIVFTYQYFGETARSAASSSVVSSIQDNKVPYSFLILFLIQFILMIVDRALYLKKNRRGKFIFQILLVIVVHCYVFFALPFITKLNFVENIPAQIWYFVKCIYFGYSSHQIRCGYPTRILGNFLTKSYSYVNLVLFKGFLIVPFLLELRSLMDWMFTDTSLGLSDWLQIEDIYSNIFVLKCFRYNENKYPTTRGSKRKAIIKYGFGGALLSAVILIIWFPLLLFSFSSGFNRTVPPTSCKVDVQIAGFLPIYSMTSQERSITQFTKEQFDDFKKIAPDESYSFIQDFTPEDVYCISIPGQSTSLWQISPPSFGNLKEQLKNLTDLYLEFSYSITRESSQEQTEQLSEMVSLSKQTRLSNDTKLSFYKILNGNTTNRVIINMTYPRYIHAKVKGNLNEIDSLKSDNFKYYVDVVIKLTNQSNGLWWDVKDKYKSDITQFCPSSTPSSLNLIVFSDKVSPKSLSFITEKGIIGIYITFVFALSRFIRIILVNSSMRIMFEQMPDVDRILKLVKSIYLVRENKKYLLEEELYAKLIFLYRSPETIIKYTRPKKYVKKNTSKYITNEWAKKSE